MNELFRDVEMSPPQETIQQLTAQLSCLITAMGVNPVSSADIQQIYGGAAKRPAPVLLEAFRVSLLTQQYVQRVGEMLAQVMNPAELSAARWEQLLDESMAQIVAREEDLRSHPEPLEKVIQPLLRQLTQKFLQAEM